MPGIFDSKNFNAEVFAAYVDTTPNLNRNELIRSRAVRQDQKLASTFKDQVGGNYAVVPIYGRIGGIAQNYDGSTDISANKTRTYTQGRIVVGRANAWLERDFSYDITGGKEFLEQAANQVGEYWDAVDQQTILSTLKGIFGMTGTANKEFVDGHTYDISGTADGIFEATTLNIGMQKALGDQKAKFDLAIMHSAVATALENLQLLEHLKYTDSNGIQRDLTLGTCNGRTVLIDDAMPAELVTPGGDELPYTKYTTYVLGEGAIEYTDCGAKVPYETDRDAKTNGGQDTLYSRQRKIFAPYGISWTDSSVISPTDAQLETGSNWSLVHSNESSKDYFPHKAIPIARIITRG